MKLSLRAEYAIRGLLALAQSYDTDVVPIQAISEQQEIPKRFLEQILNDLRAGGFVESKRGISGGYRLARPADEITMAEVLRFVEGVLGPGEGRLKGVPVQSPIDAAQIAIRELMREVRDAAVGVLKQVTIKDLSQRAADALNESRLAADYVI